MNDKPNWQVAHLDNMERWGRDIRCASTSGFRHSESTPTPGEDGTLISEHDEAGSGQEELYVVLDGRRPSKWTARWSAPARTLVYVGPESRRKATGDGTVLAVGAGTRRGVREGIDWGGRGRSTTSP